MKKIGIIGGLGPEATMEYYSGIIEHFKEKGTSMNYPEIILISVNMGQCMELLKTGKYDQLIDTIGNKIKLLENAGADYAVITANTPHMFFDDISKQSPLPMLSIVEVTRDKAEEMNIKSPLLLGTGFTMKASFFHDVFMKKDMNVKVPGEEDIQYIHDKLFTEIELGIFKDETREGLIDIIEKMHEKEKIDSVILGCTELPLILTKEKYLNLPVLNTTKLHIDSIVEYCTRN